MFTVTPLFLALLGMILSIVLMIGWAWYPKIGDPKSKMQSPLLKFLRGMFFTIYTYYALLMLDASFKIGILGFLGYGNINYHIASLLLATAFALFILLGAVFVAPTLKTFVSFVAVAIYSFIYLETADKSPDFDETDVFYKPLGIILLIFIGINLVFLIIEKVRQKPFAVVWDIADRVAPVMSFKTYWIFWILFSSEFILKMEGLSLLYWLH